MRYIKPGNSDLTVSRVRMGSRALAIRPDTAAGAQGPIMALSIAKACGAPYSGAPPFASPPACAGSMLSGGGAYRPAMGFILSIG